ncbi:hypothetical protein, partial [Bacteroides heparinolyticus]|uniref:hypothetical protein n=1 Tax=Prevotella heparinolytica TaxID=28113 RepID=UPI0035A18894
PNSDLCFFIATALLIFNANPDNLQTLFLIIGKTAMGWRKNIYLLEGVFPRSGSLYRCPRLEV